MVQNRDSEQTHTFDQLIFNEKNRQWEKDSYSPNGCGKVGLLDINQ